MNEEDKRVFEEWDKGLENCKCAACTEHRMRTLYPIWNAALEYERSRQSHPTTDELVRVLRELIEHTPDCPCMNRELWTPIAESLLQRLRFSPSEELEKLKARIAELEDAKSAPEPKPERVFTLCDCEPWICFYPNAKDAECMVRACPGWNNCPFCGKLLWRTRKVMTIERNAIVARISVGDGWSVCVASFDGTELPISDGEIRATATITFEVEE